MNKLEQQYQNELDKLESNEIATNGINLMFEKLNDEN